MGVAGGQCSAALRAIQMKLSPSVMMWGGMMGHGLTDLHFVMQESKLTLITTYTTSLKKIVKPAFNDSAVQRILFRQPNNGLFQ